MKKINFLILALCSTLMIEGSCFAAKGQQHPVVKKDANKAQRDVKKPRSNNTVNVKAQVNVKGKGGERITEPVRSSTNISPVVPPAAAVPLAEGLAGKAAAVSLAKGEVVTLPTADTLLNPVGALAGLKGAVNSANKPQESAVIPASEQSTSGNMAGS